MSTLGDWIDATKAELGIDLDVDVTELLDMTKVVAQSVARPAAPITAFLVGYAAAQSGGGAAAVTAASHAAAALAERHGAARPENPTDPDDSSLS